MTATSTAEEPLEQAACTCRVKGECETCKRWHEKITEIVQRRYEKKERGN
jgi:hypothetical protein